MANSVPRSLTIRPHLKYKVTFQRIDTDITLTFHEVYAESLIVAIAHSRDEMKLPDEWECISASRD